MVNQKLLFPEKFCVQKKAFCIPKKVSVSRKNCIPQKVFCIPKKSTTFAETLYPPKSILYPKKSGTSWGVRSREARIQGDLGGRSFQRTGPGKNCECHRSLRTQGCRHIVLISLHPHSVASVPVRRATIGDGPPQVAMRPECNTSPRQSGNSVDVVSPFCISTFEGEVPARPHHRSKQCTQQCSKMMWPRRSVVGSSSSCCPFWLLRRPFSSGRWGRQSLSKPFDLFIGGQWGRVASGIDEGCHSQPFTPSRGPTTEKKARMACRPRCNAESCPARFLSLFPSDLWTWIGRRFSTVCAPRGSSAGPGGCTYEHLKLMLDDTDSQELLLATCNLLAQVEVLAVIGTALVGALLTHYETQRWREGDCHRLYSASPRRKKRWPNSSNERDSSCLARNGPFSVRPLVLGCCALWCDGLV